MRYMSQRIMVRLLSESLLLRAPVGSLVAYVTVVLVSIFCLCNRPFLIIVKFDDWQFLIPVNIDLLEYSDHFYFLINKLLSQLRVIDSILTALHL